MRARWSRLRCWWRGHVVHLELDAETLTLRCLFCGMVSPPLDGSTFDPCLVHDADDAAPRPAGATAPTS